MCIIRRALCSPILHRTLLRQLALSPIAAVAALSFLQSSHRVLPSIKGIIRARRLCVLIYVYLPIPMYNVLVSKMYLIPMYYNVRPLLST